MNSDELLASLRVLRHRGFLALDGEDPKDTGATVFFGDIPRALLDARRQALKNKDGTGGTWFLVTDQPHNSYWLDDALCYCELFVVDVEDVETLRQELLQIKIERVT